MTEEGKARLKDAAETVNWYLKTYVPKDQLPTALGHNHLILDAITGGAYSRVKQEKGKRIAEGSDNVALNFEQPKQGWTPPSWLIEGDFPIIGRRFTPGEFLTFLRYEAAIPRVNRFQATGVTAHHTFHPDLDMRPNGFTEQHMRNLRSYYRSEIPGQKKAWKSGPHVFTDDNGIWAFTPPHLRGVHAVSFNNRFGVEMLGNFDDRDDFRDPRGKRSIQHGQFAIAALMVVHRIPRDRVNFHRHDPETSKTCPGTEIDFEDFERGVLDWYDQLKKYV